MPQKKVLTDALTQILATGSLDPNKDVVVPDVTDTKAEADPMPDPTPTVVPTTAAAGEPGEGLTTYLKAEVATLKSTLTETQAANTALQAQVAAYAADNVQGLKVALGNVVKRLSVPLNAVLPGIDTYSGSQLVGAYDELNAKLSLIVAPGAKSSTSASDPAAPKTEAQATVPPQKLTTAARFK